MSFRQLYVGLVVFKWFEKSLASDAENQEDDGQ